MNNETWIGVALGFLALLGTLGNGVLGWLTKRDQLKNDVKLALLEERAEASEKANRECQEKHDQCQEEQAAMKEQSKSHESRIAELEKSVVTRTPKDPPRNQR
jgi:hypothetical protein